MPDTEPLAARHLAAMREARIAGAAPLPARRMLKMRRTALVLAMLALLGVPSLAVADALPDRMQRAASRAAAVVGLDLPFPERDAKPASAGADEAHRGAATAPGTAEAGTAEGAGPGEATPPGNRFGQVPGGPDQGRAQPPAGDRPGASRRGTAVRPDRPDRPVRPDRPGHAKGVDRPARPDRPERPERRHPVENGGRASAAGRTGKRPGPPAKVRGDRPQAAGGSAERGSAGRGAAAG